MARLVKKSMSLKTCILSRCPRITTLLAIVGLMLRLQEMLLEVETDADLYQYLRT